MDQGEVFNGAGSDVAVCFRTPGSFTGLHQARQYVVKQNDQIDLFWKHLHGRSEMPSGSSFIGRCPMCGSGITVRERSPRVQPDDSRNRVIGFADGHLEEITEPL